MVRLRIGVTVWDVTTPTAPWELTGASVSGVGGGEYEVRFRTSETAGQRYWLQETATYQAPASVRVRGDTGLRAPAGGADAVIVTHASLKPAAEALAEWHRDHGRRALVVDAQDAYDEFNEGIYHPQAIPAMLSWAQSHWAPPGPAYLTLMGDGHWNFKGYNPAVYPAPEIMIPPYLAWVDPWQGEVPADTLFGADDNDGNDFPGMSDTIIDNHLPADITPPGLPVRPGAVHGGPCCLRSSIKIVPSWKIRRCQIVCLVLQ